MKNHLNSFYKTLNTMIRVTEVSVMSLASRRYLRRELVVKNKQRSGPQTVAMKKSQNLVHKKTDSSKNFIKNIYKKKH